MKDKATFQNKVKVLNKLFDSGCDTEKKLQQLDMEAILKIPNITIPDMGVIMELQKNTKSGKLFLPHFSCHSLRHTFTTRMCEAGVNIKVIQDTLGHKDITTTLNIYTDVTKELKRTEFDGLDKYFNNSIA